MKNPIRAWVAKVAREEIYAERWERNRKAIQEEIDNPLNWTSHDDLTQSFSMVDLGGGREAIKRRREDAS